MKKSHAGRRLRIGFVYEVKKESLKKRVFDVYLDSKFMRRILIIIIWRLRMSIFTN